MKKFILFITLMICVNNFQNTLAQEKSNMQSTSWLVPSFVVAGLGLMSGYLAYNLYNADSQSAKQKQEVVIGDYVPARDNDDLIKLFNDNSAYLGTTWDVYKARNNKRIVKIASNEDDLIGFIMFRHETTTKTGIIDYMAIDKKYRRKRYGTQLLERAIESLRNDSAEKITLSIKVHDQIAIDFYMKAGFRPDMPDLNKNDDSKVAQQKYTWFTRNIE